VVERRTLVALTRAGERGVGGFVARQLCFNSVRVLCDHLLRHQLILEVASENQKSLLSLLFSLERLKKSIYNIGLGIVCLLSLLSPLNCSIYKNEYTAI
jgi:hypothetical protein